MRAETLAEHHAQTSHPIDMKLGGFEALPWPTRAKEALSAFGAPSHVRPNPCARETGLTHCLGAGTISNSPSLAPCRTLAQCLGPWLVVRFQSTLVENGFILHIATSRQGPSLLFIGRLLEGFGVGVISYTVPVYVAEIAPKDLRGSLGSAMQLSVTIGIMLVYLLGIFFRWRILALLGIFPCAILIPGLFFIPESPRWLAKIGRMEDFEASLKALRGLNVDISLEADEIKDFVAMTRTRTTEFSDIKQRRYLFPLLVGIGLLILQQLGGINGIIFYTSNIFKAAGILSSNVATFGVGAIQVVVTVITTYLVDKAGRRLLLIVSSSGMTLSLLFVAVAFYLEDFISEDARVHSLLSLVSLVGIPAFIVSYSLGMGALPWVIMSETLPMNMKGLVGSTATFVNWFTSWVITMTADLLLNWSSGGVFTLYTAMNAFAILFVILWVPETKGRTLEEIQSTFE
ncbi:sugar transporter ERD6-like 6 isoform X2 [Magnolia sinica]|uniref:sugar transporter ERD6-like 6 isoform X2 n=1 Tax=Magnolia sinica TaxID=86752 RepID=UPI0026586D7F|nr:sugar transporter ERD6-like 6 isoform X2 [Magnolia sinica]